MFNKKTIKDVDLADKVVLLRTDYNVPIEYDRVGEAKILSDFRIKSSLDTIKFLFDSGVKKIIIISHLGRPNSVDDSSKTSELGVLPNGEFKFSLKPVFNNLKNLLENHYQKEIKMNFHTRPIFEDTKYCCSIAQADDDYKIEMLENLRFSKSEKKNSDKFARTLAEITGADFFVQDGFGVVHRAHSSTSAITKILPSVAGLLLEKEVSLIDKAIKNPPRPLTIIIGGAKISDKLPLIEKFIEISDRIIVCGAIANTFLKSRRYEVGKSKIDDIENGLISKIEKLAFDKFGNNFYEKLQLPIDVKVASEFSPDAAAINVGIDQVLPTDYILDIGNRSAVRAVRALENSKTIIWNGAAGYTEFTKFSGGSNMIAEAISSATKRGATSVVGGGDTASFVLDWQDNNEGEFSLISTGGGAALGLMSGLELPGVESLLEK